MEPNMSKENIDIVEYGKLLLSWTEDKQDAAKTRIWKEFGLNRFLDGKNYKKNKNITDEEYQCFADVFNVREHFVVTLNHKKFILKSFARFQTFFESINLKREQVEIHDDSKLTNFDEIIGYTQMWIWKTKTDIWKDAWKHHYTTNSHHPEYYRRSSKDGEIVQENMQDLDIVESVIDMIACRWERQLNGREDVKKEDLLDIQECYLKRYTDHDRAKVKTLLLKLRNTHEENI